MEELIQVLIAGGIMLAVAVVFGAILVVCSHFLAVRKDERVEQVEKLLAAAARRAARSLRRRSSRAR